VWFVVKILEFSVWFVVNIRISSKRLLQEVASLLRIYYTYDMLRLLGIILGALICGTAALVLFTVFSFTAGLNFKILALLGIIVSIAFAVFTVIKTVKLIKKLHAETPVER